MKTPKDYVIQQQGARRLQTEGNAHMSQPNDKEIKRFWEFVERTARQVDKWPAGKKWRPVQLEQEPDRTSPASKRVPH